MKLLLDTNAFIWWDSEQSRLSEIALAAILDPANEVWLSVASVWEMVIKSQLGKLSLRLPLMEIVDQQHANGIGIQDITLGHVMAVNDLPQAHKDPFDRLLAAQAIFEHAELVSPDPVFTKYPVTLIW